MTLPHRAPKTLLALACALAAAAGTSGCRSKGAASAPSAKGAAEAPGAKAAPGAEAAGAPTAAEFTRGVQEYLDRRGDLCVGRPRWPIDVPEGARSGPDAVQLPVLERLGVVTSTVLAERRDGVATPFNVRRYRLTTTGRAHYIDRQTRLPASLEDPRADEHADFCVLKLALDKVTKWQVQAGGAEAALVSYTYRVDAPPWVRDPSFQKVFPAVTRLVAGERGAELVEGFTRTPDGWTANELLPRSGTAPSQPQAAAP
jgi:hypothetical protein